MPRTSSVVVGASLHRLDGHILAHRTRHDEEGKVHLALLEQAERVHRRELRHGEVAEDEVPGRLLQRVGEGSGGLHAPPGWDVARLLQLADQQERVVLVVLDDQDA
ncbi:MAG: hypothetical protein QN158_13300 [Armatimonadota bacterium]|nr:hypothetical protein [Armatimonadota bacterium]